MTEYCSIGFCLTESSWASLWGGFGGAFSAFALAIIFEWWRRRLRRAAARSGFAKALFRTGQALKPYFDLKTSEPSENEAENAALELTRIRATLTYAANHPEHFSLDEWADIHAAQQIIEAWLEHCQRYAKAGFVDRLYRGHLDKVSAQNIARQLDTMFGPPWSIHTP